MQTQQQILDAYAAHVIHTYGRVPIAFARGEGAYMWDVDGKRYLDFVSGGRAGTGLGHCHPTVVQALKQQLETVMFISNDFHHPWGAELARRLSERSGGRKSFFCNSGAEATEGAIKLARKWGKTHGGANKHEIITFERSFHGRTYGAISATAQIKIQQGFEPVVPGFRWVPFNDLEATRAAVGADTCAIFLEPVQGESGIYPAPPEFMRGLEALCREKGLLLMVDEVQTGFGRTGRYWAYEHYGVEPDIITTAKALAGGLPIGAIIAKPEVAAAFQPGDHGCTYGGNPFSCAGAIAALQALEDGNYIENAAAVGESLKSRLNGLVGRGKVKEVRGLGLMLGLELSEPIGKAVFDRCLEAGLIINNVGDTILRLIPPIILTQQQADEGVAILEKAILQ